MIATANDRRFTGPSHRPGNLPEHISPSAAKSYLGCSLQFYFERVARIRKNVPVALHLGKAVHAALQVFHLARWRGGDDSPDAIAAAYGKSFTDLERAEGPVDFADGAEREKALLDGQRVVAAYLASTEVLTGKPRAVEVLMKESIPGLSVPLTGAMDLVEANHTPVDFKSAAAKPDQENAAFDHEIQLVSYQLLMELGTGRTPPSLDLVFLVKTKTPQVIRVSSQPADAQRKLRVIGLLETAVQGIAAQRYHPQPGIQCSWCQYKTECMAWLPGRPPMERKVI
ncbi:MAG: PD-(D/E)XK nuclease family protein [Verrucomicrobiota bacterium]